MGTRISFDNNSGKHVHSYGTVKIKKKCKHCNRPTHVVEKCMIASCAVTNKFKMKCDCRA